MRSTPSSPGWQRHLWYRTTVLKSTWKLRLGLLLGLCLVGTMTRAVWTQHLGQSLVCHEEIRPGEAILVENFDPDYAVFHRAAVLVKAGLAPRVLVPLSADRDPRHPTAVSQGIADVMVRETGLSTPEFLPIQKVEPISLNAALQIRDYLVQEQIRSLLVVTPGFRSRRSVLVYRAVLQPAGITVSCVPVFGRTTPATWTTTWHGIQDVAEQWLKLQYYRWYVLWRARIPGKPVLESWERSTTGARMVPSRATRCLHKGLRADDVCTDSPLRHDPTPCA